MKIFNYYTEKSDSKNQEIFFKAIVFGILLALAFIVGGKVLIFLIEFLIKYWMWALGLTAGLFILSRIMKGKKNKIPQRQEYY